MATSSAAVIKVLGYSCELIRAQFGSQPFDRHFHHTFSVGLVTSGVNVFSYRGRRVEVAAGSICVADPGEVHDGGLARAPWSYIDIFLAPELLGTLVREEGGKGETAFPEGVIVEPTTCRAVAQFLHAASDPAREDADELAVLALARLVTHHAVHLPPRPASRTQAIAQRAVDIITDLGGMGVSLSLLARETGVSRYRVIRAVSAAIGLTPVTYMNQLRVERAKALIRAGTPIADAALEVGFADQSHLTRLMKLRWGITPGALRPAR